MGDIELVIKIPEEEYRWIKKSDNSVFADVAEKECMLHAIKNGTPLPDGVEILTKEAYSDLCTMAANVPDTNVGDLISRQAAIDVADAVWSVTGDKNVAKVWDQIKDLPSAQQERKTGRWVERNPQNSPDCRLIECSECGNAYIVGYNIDYDDWIDGRNFCMKCGADLRGGNNGKNT